MFHRLRRVTSPSRLMIHSSLPERRVRDGFNWIAAICTAMWAYSEGMVRLGGRLLAMDAAVVLVVDLLLRLNAAMAVLAGIAFIVTRSIYCGTRGSGWLYRHLSSHGYRECRMPDVAGSPARAGQEYR